MTGISSVKTQVFIPRPPSTKDRVITFSIGFLAVAYIAILIGACWVPDCSMTEWLNNFVILIIENHNYIVGFSDVTIKCIAWLEAVWVLGYLFFMTKIQHPYRGMEYGNMHWGNAKAFSKVFANHDDKNLVEINFGNMKSKAPDKPVYVNTHNYWLAEDVYVSIDNHHTSNLNIGIVGPPGTGKSFRVSRPLLSTLSGNYLVTDPKGELSKQCGQFFEDNGYEVFVVNIESEEAMMNSTHFNPFPYLRNESDIMSLAQILFKATTPPDNANSDMFFEGMAEVLLTDLLYLMHYTYPRQDQDWEHFVELLDSTAVMANPKTRAIDNSDENGILNRFERANEEWRKTHKEDLKGLVDIRKMYHGAHETTSSIVTSLDNHCKYMKLDCVKQLLSEDEIKIEDSFGYCKKRKKSKTGKYILFIVTSEDKRYYDWITSMIYSLFFDVLYHLTAIDKSLHETLPEHLTFLMDEFANITLPDSFVEKLSTMRSRGMSAVVIIQNLIQLKRKFPNHDMDKDLIANLSIINVLGGPDKSESCKELSELFGKMTIHKQTTGLTRGNQGSSSENEDIMEKPLFSEDDIYGMAKDGPCAISIKGAYPLFEDKVQFQKSPLYPLLTRKEPYVIHRTEPLGLMKFDFDKSDCSQIPEFLAGEDAVKFLQDCTEEGVSIAKISEYDIDMITVLHQEKKEIAGKDGSTTEFWHQVEKDTFQALKEKRIKTIDFDSYEKEQLMTVQRLRRQGFSPEQIHGLDVLIHAGASYDELNTYFAVHMSVGEISEFAKLLAKAKTKSKNNN